MFRLCIHSEGKFLLCFKSLSLSRLGCFSPGVNLMVCAYWMQELLVALKHVLGTDFKRGLFPLIDTLLEER